MARQRTQLVPIWVASSAFTLHLRSAGSSAASSSEVTVIRLVRSGSVPTPRGRSHAATWVTASSVLSLLMVVMSATLLPGSARADTNCSQASGNRPTGYGYDEVKNVTICFDGQKVWKNSSGPECNVTLLPPLELREITWCGIYNDGHEWLELGMNYDYKTAWGGNLQGYSRFRFDANGNAVKSYGS